MKNLKKIICLVLAVAMVLGMTVSAYAAPLFRTTPAESLRKAAAQKFVAAFIADFNRNLARNVALSTTKLVTAQLQKINRVQKIANAVANIEYPLLGYKVPGFNDNKTFEESDPTLAQKIADLLDNIEIEAKDVVLFSDKVNGFYSPLSSAKAGEWVYVKSNVISFQPVYDFLRYSESEDNLLDAIKHSLKDGQFQETQYKSEFFRLPEELKSNNDLVSKLLGFGVNLIEVKPASQGIPAVYKFKMPARMVTAYDFEKKDIDTAIVLNLTGDFVFGKLKSVGVVDRSGDRAAEDNQKEETRRVALTPFGFNVLQFDVASEHIQEMKETSGNYLLIKVEDQMDNAEVFNDTVLANDEKLIKAFNELGNIFNNYFHVNIYVVLPVKTN